MLQILAILAFSGAVWYIAFWAMRHDKDDNAWHAADAAYEERQQKTLRAAAPFDPMSRASSGPSDPA